MTKLKNTQELENNSNIEIATIRDRDINKKTTLFKKRKNKKKKVKTTTTEALQMRCANVFLNTWLVGSRLSQTQEKT